MFLSGRAHALVLCGVLLTCNLRVSLSLAQNAGADVQGDSTPIDSSGIATPHFEAVEGVEQAVVAPPRTPQPIKVSQPAKASHDSQENSVPPTAGTAAQRDAELPELEEGLGDGELPPQGTPELADPEEVADPSEAALASPVAEPGGEQSSEEISGTQLPESELDLVEASTNRPSSTIAPEAEPSNTPQPTVAPEAEPSNTSTPSPLAEPQEAPINSSATPLLQTQPPEQFLEPQIVATPTPVADVIPPEMDSADATTDVLSPQTGPVKIEEGDAVEGEAGLEDSEAVGEQSLETDETSLDAALVTEDDTVEMAYPFDESFISPRTGRLPVPEAEMAFFVAAFVSLDANDAELRELASQTGVQMETWLHGLEGFHGVDLNDLGEIRGRTSWEIWSECTDRAACMRMLGDRGQSRVAFTGLMSRDVDNNMISLRLQFVDLEWAEVIEELTLSLPLEMIESDEESELIVLEPLSIDSDAMSAAFLALQARMVELQRLDASRAPAAVAVQLAEAPKQESGYAPIEGEILSELDRLASRVDEQPRQEGRRYLKEELDGTEVDQEEREMLSMTPAEYLLFKRVGLTEAQWRQRMKGRTGQVAARFSLGTSSGEIAQQYDGLLLMGEVSSEVVEKYARLMPATGVGMSGLIGINLGIAPDLEVEARFGTTRAMATVRTLQTFEELYPCEPDIDCPKVENVPTRVLMSEALLRYYFRRPWDLRPYVSVGLSALLFQQIPDAYNNYTSLTFPTVYDTFHPLWTMGVTSGVGFTYALSGPVSITVEIPLYFRVVNGATEPLHYYADEPVVEELMLLETVPIVAGAQFGLHYRFR